MYELVKITHSKTILKQKRVDTMRGLQSALKKYSLLTLVVGMLIVNVTYAKEPAYVEKNNKIYGEDTIHQYKHKSSGLNVIWIENKDDNLAFTLGVKTPTTDSTGVNHIIEHTIFTGSKKYPSSTAFFDASAQYPTLFMNALTSADLTMYPFCTPYKECFEHLFDIYLDSIFNPNMLNQPYSFYEEAFHYNPETKRYGGVVFNEMKGVSTDLNRMLFKTMRTSFYEDSHYANESGGSVGEIPTLTYEQFVKTYHDYYYPSNMMIILYGDMKIDPMLKAIDGYVKDYPLTDQFVDVNVEPKSNKAIALATYDSKGSNAHLIKSFLIKEDLSAEDALNLDLWVQTYLADDQSLFQKRLRELGIQGVQVIKDDSMRYPIYGIFIKDIVEYNLEKTQIFVEGALAEAVNANAPKQEEDAINKIKLSFYQNDQNPKRGIAIADSMLDAWAHNKTLAQYYEIREALEKLSFDASGEVTQNIKKSFENALTQTTYVLPKSEEEKQPLQQSPIEEDKWGTLTKDIQLWQHETANQPLPEIKLKQFMIKPEMPKIQEKDNITYMLSPTEGKLYQTNLYLPTGHIAQEDLHELFLYSKMLGRIAEEHTPFQGQVQVSVQGIDEQKDGQMQPYLQFHFVTTEPEDAFMLYESLTQTLQEKENSWFNKTLEEYTQSFKESFDGDLLANLKMLSAGGQSGSKRYAYEGHYPLYGYAQELLKQQDATYIAEIKRVGQTIGLCEKSAIGITAPSRQLQEVQTLWETYAKQHKVEVPSYNKYDLIKNVQMNVYYKKTPVDYIVCSYDKGSDWIDGVDYVMAAYATNHYLQPHIRVAKGAYGSGMHAIYPNTLSVYTYRDPDYQSSLKSIEQMSDALRGTLTLPKLEGAKADALAQYQNQFKLLGTSLEKSSTLEKLLLAGVSGDDMQNMQKQIINTSEDELDQKLALLKYIIPKSQVGICTDKARGDKMSLAQDYTIE